MAHLSRGQDLAWLSAVPDSAEFLINKQIIRRELNRERKYKCQSEIKIIATRGCSRQRWALIISRTPHDSLGERSVWLSAVRESAQRCPGKRSALFRMALSQGKYKYLFEIAKICKIIWIWRLYGIELFKQFRPENIFFFLIAGTG